MCVPRAPTTAKDNPAAAALGWCLPRRPDRRNVRFSFAVISDTHSHHACRAEQGPRLKDGIAALNAMKPDFVLGLGDLISGGGDCGQWSGAKKVPAHDQLIALRRVLLEELRVPFVPVSGNHDLTPADSTDREEPTRAWTKFWRTHRRYLLPAVRQMDASESFRFTYKGVSFALVSSYGTVGLKAKEMSWIRKNVRVGDLVFRHVNPFGISPAAGLCLGGRAQDRQAAYHLPRVERLLRLFPALRSKALPCSHQDASPSAGGPVRGHHGDLPQPTQSILTFPLKSQHIGCVSLARH